MHLQMPWDDECIHSQKRLAITTSDTSVSNGDEVVDTMPINIASRIDKSESMKVRHYLYESTGRWRHSNDINPAQRGIELVMTL